MGTANESGTFYRPALLNFGLGLLAFVATTSATVGISLWADVRMLSRDRDELSADLAELQDWRREFAGVSPADWRRLSERIATIELWMARHDAGIQFQPGPVKR